VKPLVKTVDLHTNFYTFEGVVRALNGVSIVVNQGETYALVGESGCGKSVTVRSMMRIVQNPGKIEQGKILIFFNEADKDQGIDILNRSEAFMESLRGNDISMIFQEASASLNPVLSIAEQVGESFFAHRSGEMLASTIGTIEAELNEGRNFLVRFWRNFQLTMYRREAADLERFKGWMVDFDNRLYELEDSTEGASVRERNRIKAHRERYNRTGLLIRFVKKVPFLRRYYGRVRNTVKHEVIKLLTSLGIPNPANIADRFPHELSGGMQQRIVIAMALACNPILLIADEPTSNLDVTIQAQIVELIRKLKETVISSVLYITHDLGLVAEICDRVTVMYAGDTCETATVAEIFERPLHPYTEGLLKAVPKVDQEGALNTIPGNVPNLVHPPTGCRFHPRCPKAMDICSKQKPTPVEYSSGHTVSCHLYLPKENQA